MFVAANGVLRDLKRLTLDGVRGVLKWLMLPFASALVGIAAATSPTFAASFGKIDAFSSAEVTSILLYGPIQAGDMNELLSLQGSNKTKTTVLFLESPGGDATEGLLIAKFVHNLNWDTAVVKDAKCFSACATIWIAGHKKYLSSTALLGFHDVYDKSGPSAPGNALVGSFYGQLGLSDRVIEYLTSAPPDKINSVDMAIASSIGLGVIDFDKLMDSPTPPPAPTVSERPPELPKSADNEITQTSIPPPPNSRPAPETKSVNEPTFTRLTEADIVGHDIPNAAASALSPEYCQQICESRLECLAFTYDLKHQVCYPKDGGKLKLFNQSAISGAKAELLAGLKMSSITLSRKTKFMGTEYRRIAPSQIGDCIEQCDLDSTCKGLSYNSAKNTCLLFNLDSNTSRTIGWLAGLKK